MCQPERESRSTKEDEAKFVEIEEEARARARLSPKPSARLASQRNAFYMTNKKGRYVPFSSVFHFGIEPREREGCESQGEGQTGQMGDKRAKRLKLEKRIMK